MGIIATLNKADDFFASPNWLGKHSSECEIAQSGLWLKEGLNDIPLSESEYIRIEFLCNVMPSAPTMPKVSKQNVNMEKPQRNSFKPTYTKKYAPLTEYLLKISSNEITLTLCYYRFGHHSR